jgi:Arc/MetJ-type ribon-helix-helix transcriptional regulator
MPGRNEPEKEHTMQRTNIYLEDDQLRLLKHLAAEQRQSVADLVRRAVDLYLSQRLADDADWRVRLDQLVARIQARVPQEVSPDEIEADITAAQAEVKQARRAARGR